VAQRPSAPARGAVALADCLGMADAATVRRLTGSLPDVDEGTSFGTPSWKVRGKFFARLRDGDTVLVAKVDKGEKQLLMQAEPDVFFETPHYHGYGYVLVRLANIDEDELAEVVEDAWRLAAPKTLVRERDEARSA
jgi:hypothetical protein